MRQLIIVRKDLHMSPGKLAAQVSHASMAFLTNMIKNNSNALMKYQDCPAVQINRITGKKEPYMYRRTDLSLFAAKAFEQGKDSFVFRPVDPDNPYGELEICENEIVGYSAKLFFDRETYENWICGIFTKTICEARNKNHLVKVIDTAVGLGLEENKDFFLIKDSCLTELEPEEFDENGIGRTLTCVGFKPLDEEKSHILSKKYQLYR